MKNEVDEAELLAATNLLYNELRKENERNEMHKFSEIEGLSEGIPSKAVVDATDRYLDLLGDYYIEQYNIYSDEKDRLLIQLNQNEEEKEAFIELKNMYTNESLEDLVTNKNDLDKIIEWKGELIQRADPIYKNPRGFRAHFLAPSKKLFGTYITTFSANLLVIWSFSIFLAITLYYDALRKLLKNLGKLLKRKEY